MNRLQLSIYKSPPFRYIFKRAHQVILPGLNGATLFEVGKFFFREIRTLNLQERAAAVTYNFLMAMAPTFLFLLSLLPYLPLKNVDKAIFNIIKLATPNYNVYVNVHNIVTDFMAKQHVGALSYGLVLILFFASNGVIGLMRCFDKSLPLYKKRNGFQRRWTAIKLTIMLIGISIITLAVLILQNKNLNSFILHTFHSVAAVKTLSFIILILLIFISISTIYSYGPSLTYKFRFVSAGSVFATFAAVVATSVFFFLVNNFINYNKIYGSVGTLIAFMIWIWINTIIILLGFELNVSLLLGKLSQQDDDDDVKNNQTESTALK
jgi:membrane protein